jgi:hypothetical protein
MRFMNHSQGAEAMKPYQYKHIRAWGRMMRSHEYYITGQQEQACNDGAPIDAVYREQDGNWCSFANVTEQSTIDGIHQELERMQLSKRDPTEDIRRGMVESGQPYRERRNAAER